MKPEWKTFLVDNGAEFDEDGLTVRHFGNPERERRILLTGEVFSDLSSHGLISAYGEDAETFLQNMLSNDILAVNEGHTQLSSLCNNKGRAIAVFRIFRRGETFYLRLPRSLLETALKRLQMFVLMSKVTLEDASDALVRLGYSGPEAERELAERLGGVPAEPDQAGEWQGITVLRIAGPVPRFELYGELEAMQKLWTHLNVRGAPVGVDHWPLLDILAGLPNVYPQTSEAFVPQMLNLHAVNGISFKKGCYPGQEVVARMQYLGKLKRRMYRVDLDAAEPPEPGTELFAEGGSEAAGQIVDARLDPDGRSVGLAVLKIAETDKPLHLAAVDGPAVTVGDVPYPVPLGKEE
ncbi:MAG: folate-binding protein [Gammaproteobacteria bacterium]|nr:MAG: folate-binding protein [Gammaproteobacteria bacterium]